jgi:peptidoglycan/xylan/chitin deacetylase (PgdA/CDA1 family)
MLRTFVKTAAAYAVSLTRLDALARQSLHRRLPFVICYHRVVERLTADGGALPAMEIGVATLERHLDWLGQYFRIVSVDDLPADLEQPRGSKPLAAITFDDGYSDIYHNAFPLLRRKGIPAGIFVVTQELGSSDLPIAERLYGLLFGAARQHRLTADDVTNLLREANVDRSIAERARRVANDPFLATQFLLANLPRIDVENVMQSLKATGKTEAWREALHPLNWEMLAEMRDAGMTIGSHSKTHAYMTNESEDRMLDEAAASRRELQSRLGIDVRSFAYPGGFFNPAVVNAVATAGYRLGFTICRHRDLQNPMLTIPRTGLWEQSCLDPFGRFSPAIMSCQTAGAFTWMARCTQAHAETRVFAASLSAARADRSL